MVIITKTLRHVIAKKSLCVCKYWNLVPLFPRAEFYICLWTIIVIFHENVNHKQFHNYFKKLHLRVALAKAFNLNVFNFFNKNSELKISTITAYSICPNIYNNSWKYSSLVQYYTQSSYALNVNSVFINCMRQIQPKIDDKCKSKTIYIWKKSSPELSTRNLSQKKDGKNAVFYITLYIN